jgi:hypothetical protein
MIRMAEMNVASVESRDAEHHLGLLSRPWRNQGRSSSGQILDGRARCQGCQSLERFCNPRICSDAEVSVPPRSTAGYLYGQVSVRGDALAAHQALEAALI